MVGLADIEEGYGHESEKRNKNESVKRNRNGSVTMRRKRMRYKLFSNTVTGDRQSECESRKIKVRVISHQEETIIIN